MTCREFAEILDRYLAGELSPEQRLVFDEHLAECEDCVHYLESYREAVQLTAEALGPDAAVPAEVPEGLVRAVMSRIR